MNSPNMEDRFIELSEKINAVDACIGTLINGYLAVCPREASPAEAQEHRRAGTMALIAAEYIAQADKLLWNLESACDAEFQTTHIDLEAHISVKAPAKNTQRECCGKGVAV